MAKLADFHNILYEKSHKTGYRDISLKEMQVQQANNQRTDEQSSN